MLYTVKFPIKNKIILEEIWPVIIEKGTFFVQKNDKNIVTYVGCRFHDVPASHAPKIETAHQARGSTQISFRQSMVSSVEADIRSWQSLLCGYSLFDVDYDNPIEEYRAETEDERPLIPISSFERSSKQANSINLDFSIIGRSFIAAPLHHDLSEKMSFFIEGQRAIAVNRIVDAYNYLYLFLESNFRLKFKSKDATKELSKRPEFQDAVDEYLSDQMLIDQQIFTKFPGIVEWSSDKIQLAKNIVDLRGALRHHSLGNPSRWKYANQEEYRCEAVFMGMLCQSIAQKSVFNVILEEPYPSQFRELSKKIGAIVKIIVHVTYVEASIPREQSIRMSFPALGLSPELAKAVLENSLKSFNTKCPAGKLLAIRAFSEEGRHEVLRYDIGPSIGRS